MPCKGSVFGSVSGLLHLQTSPTRYRLVTTRLVGFGADGVHPLLDEAARTSQVEKERSRSPFRTTLTCGADWSTRSGSGGHSNGESTGCATCINFGEEERNAKIPWQREQRDRWFKQDEDRSNHELRRRSFNGRTCGGDATGGCARAKNIFRDVIDGSSIFQGSSSQCQQF